MPDGHMPHPETDAVRAALQRVSPHVAADPALLASEVAWTWVRMRRNDRGQIFWCSSDLGRALRERMAEAQNHRCCWCGGRMMAKHGPAAPSIEHVIPLALGGADHPDNMAVAHRGCNSARGARLSFSSKEAQHV